MTPPEPLSLRPFDPRITLATNLEAQPGVYALLIGSGVSTAVGIPTGWGVVESLARKVALANGVELAGHDDWQQWWLDHTGGQPLGYSTLLELLGSTPAARRALLAGYFEPTDKDRDEGLRVPGQAHRAIAKLVARGSVKVIITTNFDRLIEQALEAEGVMPQIIATEAAVLGMEPLQHSVPTVIKLHGDYAALEQRNTVDELRAYPEALATLLRRVLDEYGLIVSGWSGEWDNALVTTLEATANRRYPLYWTAFSEPGPIAARLTARAGAHTIENVAAEQFFPDLLERVEAVAQLTHPPADVAVKLTRLRRALPDPIRHLEVRRLFEDELSILRQWVQDRARSPSDDALETFDAELTSIGNRVRPLLQLYVEGIHLDRDRQHSDLWVWVLQQALNARAAGFGSYTEAWDNLAHYPALLLLRGGTMAAIAAGHEDVIVRLASEPTWHTFLVRQDEEHIANDVLHLHNVLDHQTLRQLPRWNGSSPYHPASKLIRAELSELATELAGPNDTERLLNRMEYRIALASYLFRPDPTYHRSAAGGEFIGEWPWHDADGHRVASTADFLRHGDHATWARAVDTEEEFSTKLTELDEHLGRIRDRD